MSFGKERCPKCHTDDCDYDEIKTPDDEKTVTFEWFCYKCRAWWNVEYVFSKRYDVENTDPE